MGIHPCRLLNEDGKPAHWVEVENDNKVTLALSVTEWQMPVAEAGASWRTSSFSDGM